VVVLAIGLASLSLGGGHQAPATPPVPTTRRLRRPEPV
jgi:hypothetical protein